MNENIQNQQVNQQITDTQVNQQPAKPVLKKKDEEFSLKWHLKVLAIIYVILGILYIILRVYLK